MSSVNGLLLLREAAMFVDKNEKVINKRPSTRVQPLVASTHIANTLSSPPYNNRGAHSFTPPSTTAVRVTLAPAKTTLLRPTNVTAANLIRSLPVVSRQSATVISRPSSIGVSQLQIRRNSAAASRSSHNELEKNRRAHLRRRLDELREQLPISKAEANRLTMLNVLNRTVDYIKSLEMDNRNHRDKLNTCDKEKKMLTCRRISLQKKMKVARRMVARRRLQQVKSYKTANNAASSTTAASTMMPAPTHAPPLSAAAAAALRCRNVSEVSNTSASSEENELMSMANTTGATTLIGRSDGCGSPDSGYASPNTCKSLVAT